MQPRYYQNEAVGSSLGFLVENPEGNPLIEAPTGTGKSVIIAEIIRRALAKYRGTRLMMLTHSKELVKQNSEKLRTIWPDVPLGMYHAGLKSYQTHYPVTFAGIDSVAKKAHIFGTQHIVLIDEAHMVDFKPKTRYREFLDGLKKQNPRLRGIGLTATPWRHGIGHITNGGFWTHTAYSKIGVDDFHEFVAHGFLAPLYPLRTELQIDVTGVGTSVGDYNQTELQKASDKEEITRAAIAESLQLAHDRKHWLVFCTGTEHVDNTVRYLREAGISAMGVHSKKSDAENDLAIQMYLDGHVRALVNMGVLTTGFDAPETDYIMMLRATQSAVLWVQMLGRGTRPAPWCGKTDCLVGDFAGNARRLGPINDPVVPRPKGQGKGVAPIRTCCDEWDHSGASPVQIRIGCGCENHASARTCIRCGVEFAPVKTKLKTRAGSEKMMQDAGSGSSQSSEPQIDIFRVDSITYAKHSKQGKPDSLKVTYSCGFRMFSEYVCLEHSGYALDKARKWWRKHKPGEVPPDTIPEALMLTDGLMPVTHIRIWINKPYPEIMDHCFDGSGWGQVVANEGEAASRKPDPERAAPPRVRMSEFDARSIAEFDGVPFDADEWRRKEAELDRLESLTSVYDDDIPF